MRSSCGEVDKLIGERIRTLRNIRRITSGQLGKEIGVSHQQVTKYERAINKIAASKLLLVAQVLSQDISWFYKEGK